MGGGGWGFSNGFCSGTGQCSAALLVDFGFGSWIHYMERRNKK